MTEINLFPQTNERISIVPLSPWTTEMPPEPMFPHREDVLYPPHRRRQARIEATKRQRNARTQFRRRRALPLPKVHAFASLLRENGPRHRKHQHRIQRLKDHREVPGRKKNAAFIDVLAISCDSFNAKTNVKIGRGVDGKNVEQLQKIAGWCRRFGIKFKINSVVCSLNWDEDMTALLETLQPFRWKGFQCLIVTGENENEERKRDARSFLVTELQWRVFCERHKHLACFVPESNEAMKGSYLILDEYMRFLDKGDGEEKASDSILGVGVRKAMTQVRFDREMFVERGGFYDWTKGDDGGCSGGAKCAEDLEWW